MRRLLLFEGLSRSCLYIAVFLSFLALFDYGVFLISGKTLESRPYRVFLSLLWNVSAVYILWKFLLGPIRKRISREQIAKLFISREPNSIDERYFLAAVDFTDYPPNGESQLRDHVFEEVSRYDLTADVLDKSSQKRFLQRFMMLALMLMGLFFVLPDWTNTAFARILFPLQPRSWSIIPENAPDPGNTIKAPPDTTDSTSIQTPKLSRSDAMSKSRHYLEIIRDELKRALRMQISTRELLQEKSSGNPSVLKYWQNEVRIILLDEQTGIPHYVNQLKTAVKTGSLDKYPNFDNPSETIENCLVKLEKEEIFPLEVLFSEWIRSSSVFEQTKSEIVSHQENIERTIRKLLLEIENREKIDRLYDDWGALFGKQVAVYKRSKREFSETVGMTVFELTSGRRQLLQAMAEEQRSIAEKYQKLAIETPPILNGFEIDQNFLEKVEISAKSMESNRLGISLNKQLDILFSLAPFAKYAPEFEEFTPIMIARSGKSTGINDVTDWIIVPDASNGPEPPEKETTDAVIPNIGETERGDPNNRNAPRSEDPGSGTGANALSGSSSVTPETTKEFDLREIWGELPERYRKDWTDPSKEEPLPKYHEAIERYYDRLLKFGR